MPSTRNTTAKDLIRTLSDYRLMNKPNHRLTKLCLHSALVFALTSTTAHSADTDVYLNQSSTVYPNVMFSMDTSGSMQAWYTTISAPPDYRSSQNYSGVFDTGRFYISVDGRVPTSTSGIASAPLASLDNCDFADDPLDDDGFTAIRAAVAFSSAATTNYPTLRWLPATKAHFDVSNSSHVSIECSDDSGRHGANASSGSRYANTLSGVSGTLYTTNATNEIDWDKYPFVTVYSGQYLNYKTNPPNNVSMAREVLQNRVIRDAVKRTPDIMAGLARMYGTRGGAIIRAAKNNSVRANQDELLQTLASTSYGGGTPLATTLLEIMHYYHGLPINRSADYYHGSSVSHDRSYGRLPTDPDARTGGTYNSPITYECQKNYVILVTDGEPSWDTGADTDFRASNSLYPNYNAHTGKSYCTGGNCLDELSGYMSKQDAAPSLENNYDLDGDSLPDPQTVKVYPIGMETQQTLLDNSAAAAGTESYYASDALEFENAFVEILANIKESGGVSMVTATSSNDRFSKTSNREYLYYGQFVPSNNFQWRGNLKKYRYAYNADSVAYITDTDTTGNPDITTPDGSIIGSARSYWSTSADGNEALKGGVLDRLKLRGANGRLIRGINASGDINVPIMTNSNQLSTANNAYNTGVNANDRTSAERNKIASYALGQDVKDEDEDNNTSEQRGAMGGIVRSSPVAVQYGGTAATPEVVIFATTTDGVLHAFDDDTGDELWSVVMPEAYPYLAEQYDNYYSSTPWWGIDGSLSSRVVDVNENGVIESGDKVYLYISGGMDLRRWFIVDVTNATKSSDQATLVRRGKYDATSSDWDELGLAISPMIPMTYRLQNDATGVVRSAMIYANGWDAAAEFSYLPENTMGRGLSLYDADSGDVLWKKSRNYGGADMKYSFATQPTTVDLNGDGFTDLIYAIDVNAQIWRFNVNNGASTTAALITGGKLATLGNDSDGNRRRAYKRIDAAVVKTGTSNQVILAVGTGDRMNPLSETDNDRLYVIRDQSASAGASPTAVLTENDMYDATANTIGEGSTSAQDTALTTLSGKTGWYINLPAGEQKAISAPLISSGIVNFPVYQVGGAASNPCEDNSMGTGLLYRMNILDATPAADYDGDSNLTAGDRFTVIRGGGIPGDVVFHTSPTGIKTLIVNRDPFVNRPDVMDPTKNATPDDSLQGDAAGYWFEE